MPDFSEVVSQAMELPDNKRADLAHQLLISLQQEDDQRAETLEDVVLARQKRVSSGRYTAYDASDTLDRMRKSLDDRNES